MSSPKRRWSSGSLFDVRLARGIASFILVCSVGATRAEAQFDSGSDGSDGTFFAGGPPGTVVVFDPSQYSGTQVSANIFNFTTITIQAGVTVRLGGDKINGPVFWLAQGDVNIAGTIDLSGGNGYDATANPFLRAPSVPGAGGYPGGVGGTINQNPLAGSGPGGGSAGTNTTDCVGHGGTFSGNQFLIPLIGGSGGGGAYYGCYLAIGAGGGAGGGAILIASSTQILVNGTINAKGGPFGYYLAGHGSGGAIRLVANVIAGNGTLNVSSCTGCASGDKRAGSPGRIRLEAFDIQASISNQSSNQSSPFPLLLPTAGLPTAKVISINGIGVIPNPNTFPDITINTASAVPVVVQTHNIPVTATINVTILNQNNVPDTVIQAPPLGDCDLNNFCTTTVNVVFPFGASRGLTKVTWTQ